MADFLFSFPVNFHLGKSEDSVVKTFMLRKFYAIRETWFIITYLFIIFREKVVSKEYSTKTCSVKEDIFWMLA